MHEWGVLAPVVFILLQALQVIYLARFPGEATGFLGGYLFGSLAGLHLLHRSGSPWARWARSGSGAGSARTSCANSCARKRWDRLGFIVEAEGAILCFIIYLIPGLPKDIVCYLFGISPMPLWVFALVSGLGRMPGTWVLSAQGARTATGHYWHAILLTAIVVAAVALPLYYYRHQIVGWCRGGATAGRGEALARRRLDTNERGLVE